MQATAADLIRERGLFVDPGGELSFEQVQRQPFSPVGKLVTQGFTRSTLWLRLVVDPAEASQQALLRVLPAALDEVTLFGDGATSKYGPLGLRIGLDQLLDPSGAAPRTYYLRVKTTGSAVLWTEVLAGAERMEAQYRRAIHLGAMLAAVVPISLALLVSLMLRRNMLHGMFLLSLIALAANFLLWYGHGQVDGSPGNRPAPGIQHFATLCNVCGVSLFYGELLKKFEIPPWGAQCFRFSGLVWICLFALFPWLDRQYLLMLVMVAGAFVSGICLVLTALIFIRDRKAFWLLALVIAVAMSNWLYGILALLGLVEAWPDAIDMPFWLVIAMPIHLAVLLWLLDRNHRHQLQVLALTQARAMALAETEKVRRGVHARFTAMLAQEVRTPLATIQLAAASLGRGLMNDSDKSPRIDSINQAVDDLNSIVERCVQVDQFERGEAAIDQRKFAVKNLVEDLRNLLDADRISLLDRPMVTVTSDYLALRIILMNLLSNALKYSPPNSKVEVDIETTPRRGVKALRIAVSNVIGAAGKPDPALLFSRYYRAEAARRFAGAGLGLWLAQAMARRLGSEISYRAEQESVSFEFWLEMT